MQPTIPNPQEVVLSINMMMTGAATAKEADLQGASSGPASNAALALAQAANKALAARSAQGSLDEADVSET